MFLSVIHALLTKILVGKKRYLCSRLSRHVGRHDFTGNSKETGNDLREMYDPKAFWEYVHQIWRPNRQFG